MPMIKRNSEETLQDTNGISDQVSIGYKDARFRFSGISGIHLFQTLIFILCFGGVSVQLWQMNALAAERHINEMAKDNDMHKMLSHVIQQQDRIIAEMAFSNKSLEQAIKDSADAQVYVLSLNPQAREALKLDMPKTVREKIKPRRPRDE